MKLLIVVFAALICIALAGRGKRCERRNRNYPGLDMKGKMIKTKTMRDCAFYCLNLKGCNYISWSSTRKGCWPKKKPGVKGRLTAQRGTVSGNMRCYRRAFAKHRCYHHHKNFKGHDMKGKMNKQPNFAACVMRCMRLKGCKFVSYDPKRKTCWPKNKSGGLHKQRHTRSASMHCVRRHY